MSFSCKKKKKIQGSVRDGILGRHDNSLITILLMTGLSVFIYMYLFLENWAARIAKILMQRILKVVKFKNFIN